MFFLACLPQKMRPRAQFKMKFKNKTRFGKPFLSGIQCWFQIVNRIFFKNLAINMPKAYNLIKCIYVQGAFLACLPQKMRPRTQFKVKFKKKTPFGKPYL